MKHSRQPRFQQHPRAAQAHRLGFGLSSDQQIQSAKPRVNTALTRGAKPFSFPALQLLGSDRIRPTRRLQPLLRQPLAAVPRHSFLWFPTLWAQQRPATAALPSSTKATETLPRCSALRAPQASYPALFPAAPEVEMFQIS